MNKQLLSVGLMVSLLVSMPAYAKLYKWVDENGVTHYGQTIPPQYADKDRVEMQEGWRVSDETDVLTPAQIRERREAEQKARQREAAIIERQREQARRDNALLSTYTTVSEIDLAKERNTEQVDLKVKSLTRQTNLLGEKLTNLKMEEIGYLQKDKAVPQSLKQDLDNTLDRLARMQLELKKAEAEKHKLEQKFERDKQRFIQLKQQQQTAGQY